MKRAELTWHARESEKFFIWRLGKYFRCCSKEQRSQPPKIGFALMNGRFCHGTAAVLAVWVYESSILGFFFLCARVCACECLCDRALSSENQQKPVISRVNAGWKANMRINWGTYHNNTWKMEQSVFLQSKARLFITLGRCLVASLVCLLWALKLI